MGGPNTDGPVVCANVLWKLPLPEGRQVLLALESAMILLGGRPHLGKVHNAYLIDGLGQSESEWSQRADEFVACVAAADPQGRFGGEEAARAALDSSNG